MNVAIIGTGNVGSALGSSIRRAGHEVVFAARNAEKAREIAGRLGAHAAESPSKAARDADVIILAVPFPALPDVAHELARPAAGKVIIDVTNPMGQTDDGRSAAEQLAERLPGARVVKAFNTLFGSFQAEPDLLDTRVDALFATDDDEARDKVAELIRSLGLRPIDVGGLEAARQMEAMAWLNIQLQLRYDGDWRSTFVLVGAPEAAIKG
jgi:8-hydroxy-5-deazaflavin:NADPH oxidoreductase